MPTIRLTCTQVYNSAGTTYLTVADSVNMLTNCDSTTYGTITNIYASTSNRYAYLQNFNFSAVPSDAVVTSFTIKLKASETGAYSNRPRICNNTTTLTGSSSTIGTTANVITFTGVTDSWETIKGYGNNFRIRINCRRAQSGTEAVINVYGAEIEVEYKLPSNITTTLTGDGTIDPSGTVSVFDEDEFTLTITPSNASDTVTATKDGSSVTLTRHEGGEVEDSNVLGAYHLVSGGFNGQGASYFQGIVGHGHTATQTTSNYYSSGSGTQAVFQYDVSFDDVPSNATIKSLYMMANGHAESTSQSSEYMCVQLKSGSTALSAQYNFKSAGTSNSTQTINATTLPTVAQLESLVVECTLGYYGGAINGVTVFLTYEVSGVWYTYTYTVNGDATIAVVIGSSGDTDKMFIKANGAWAEVSAVYVKTNGTWVQQTNLRNIFNTSGKYVKVET